MKGKGGKRGVASLFCKMRTRPTRATQGATARREQRTEGQRQGDTEKKRETERWSANRAAPSTIAQTQEQNEDAQQEDSATRKKIEARTKYAKEFLRVPVSLPCVTNENDGVPFFVLVVGFFSLSFL